MKVMHVEFAEDSDAKETALITRFGLATAGISRVDLWIRSELERNS